MKKFLSLLVLSTALAGCGGSRDFSASPNTTPQGNTLAQTIPAGGGEVNIPEGTGFRGRLLFDPGAAAGTEITMSSSVEAPQSARLPLVGLNSPHATTESFFWLRFSVNQPTPLSLLEGIRLQGSIPDDHEHYHADLYQLGSPGRAQSDGQSRFLQEIPGEFKGSEAVFDEVTDSGILQPGVDYGVRFKSTDQQTLDLTIINDSGISPCYLTIRGENPNLAAGDQRTYRVTQDGAFVPMDYDDLVNGSADYNILLPDDGKIKLPLMASGRIYFSLGEKLKTQLDPQRTPDGPPCYWVAPDGWSDSAKLNFKTLWDWVEFDYKISPDSNLPGMGINTTQVQMMGIPTALSLTGPTSGTQTSGAKGAGTRSQIFSTLEADPIFKALILEGTATGTNASPIRAVSADNAIRNVTLKRPNVPTFSTTYYDSYIDQVWEKYKSEDLIMETSAFGTFRGRVNAQDQMVFTQQGQRSVVIPKPGTTDVIVGDGLLLADLPNCRNQRDRDIVNEHASTMSACFNRSTLLVFPKMLRNPIPGTFDPDIFYQTLPTNLYSKLNHTLSLPTPQAAAGGAYGFGFDDNLNQSSFISDNKAPTSLTITIPKF